MLAAKMRVAGLAVAFALSSAVAGMSDSLIKCLEVIAVTMMYAPTQMTINPSALFDMGTSVKLSHGHYGQQGMTFAGLAPD